MILEEVGDEHALTEELGHGLGICATLSREASSLEPAQDRRVLLHAGERPLRREHSRHPARTVLTIDPEHPEIERDHRSNLDAVALLQMLVQTINARWFKHPPRTIPAGQRGPERR